VLYFFETIMAELYLDPTRDAMAGTYAQQQQAAAEMTAAVYYTSMEAYAPFDHTDDGRRLGGCIDPRPDNTPGDRQMTKIQGPGGEVGEADDHATALSIVQNRLVTIEEAAQEDMALRRTSVHGAHRSVCAYVESFAAVKAEQADPSAVTLHAVARWIREHELDMVTGQVLGHVIEVSGQQLKQLGRSGGVEHVVDTVDRAFPGHTNVPEMRGPASPGFYIVNGYPHLGLDRHNKHDVKQVRAQAYHDSLRARIDDINNTHAMPAAVRQHRIGALLLRSAATRTVIDRVKREAGRPLRHIEVGIGDNGPVFTQVSLP
jgi:hypothetical protein